MEPLGRNSGAYHGERIHIEEVVHAIAAVAGHRNWAGEHLECANGRELLTLHRRPNTASRAVYISAGIHGDEPAGPMAVLRLLEADTWPADCAVYLCPCLNPSGFQLNTRESAEGIDLNRDYRHATAPEIAVHQTWLRAQPCFDMGIHLHEDWESKGFYLYELNPHGLPAKSRAIVEAVAEVCPIDLASEIEDFAADQGVIHPDVKPESRQDWPEAFFMVQEKTRISYTLEAPSDFPLPTRVEALKTAVEALLR